MLESLAAIFISMASLFGVSADSAAQSACNIAADYYETADIVCTYDNGVFAVFAD